MWFLCNNVRLPAVLEFRTGPFKDLFIATRQDLFRYLDCTPLACSADLQKLTLSDILQHQLQNPLLVLQIHVTEAAVQLRHHVSYWPFQNLLDYNTIMVLRGQMSTCSLNEKFSNNKSYLLISIYSQGLVPRQAQSTSFPGSAASYDEHARPNCTNQVIPIKGDGVTVAMGKQDASRDRK